MPTVLEKQSRVLSPWVSVGLILFGLAFALIRANLSKQTIDIAIGGEIALLAYASLLLKNQLGMLAKALLALGVALPFLTAGLAPVYFPTRSEWLVSSGFWIMFGLGVIQGLVIFFVGVFLFAEIDKGAVKASKNTPWIRGMNLLYHVWILLTLSTTFIGEWTPYTLIVVYIGIILFLLGLVVVIPYRFKRGKRGAAKVMLSLGIGGSLVSLIAWLFGAGRIKPDEMLMMLVPSLLVLVLGIGLWIHYLKTRAKKKV